MKKNILFIISILLLMNAAIYAQNDTLSFRFNNPMIVGPNDDSLQFDIQIKCDIAGTYIRASLVEFEYDTVAFGEAIVINNKVTYHPLGLTAEEYASAPKLWMKNPADNSPIKYSQIIETNYMNFSPVTLPDFFAEVPTVWTDYMRIKIRIADSSREAGIHFHTNMHGEEIKQIDNGSGGGMGAFYSEPNRFDNDLDDLFLGFIFSANTWTPAAPNYNCTDENISVWTGSGHITNSGTQVKKLRIHDQSSTSIGRAKLNIDPDKSLTIYDTVYMGDSLVLLASMDTSMISGSLIDEGLVSGEHQDYVRAELFIYDTVWHMISSPVEEALSESFYSIWMRDFDESINNWGEWITPVNIPMPPGKGFIVQSLPDSLGDVIVSIPDTFQSAGYFNTKYFPDGYINRTITRLDQGYNLVGNPFPSAINWDASSGLDLADVGSSIWLWDPVNAQYGDYTRGNGGTGNNGASNIIPAMQGFFIQASQSGSLGFNNEARVHDLRPFWKNEIPSTAKTNEEILQLRVQGDNIPTYNETILAFRSDASNDYDPLLDPEKWHSPNPDAPDIWSIIGEMEISSNHFLDFDNSLSIPIGFQKGKDEDYTISARFTESFDESINIYLEDLQTSAYQDLKLFPEYAFSQLNKEKDQRFIIHFKKAAGINELSHKVNIYSWKKFIYIHSQQELIHAEVSVFDMMGRTVYRGSLENSTFQKIELPKAKGYYAVELISDNKHLSQKVLIF